MEEFVYDCRNRLIKAGDTSYEYDAENNRTAVTTGTKRTEYMVNRQPELSQVLQGRITEGDYLLSLREGTAVTGKCDWGYREYHWRIRDYMKNTRQGLEKFIYTGVIIFIIIDLYIKMFAQQFDYLYYKLNKASYDVVAAQVMEKREKTIIMGKTEPLLTYTEILISYKINGLDYVNRISKYPEVKQFDTIYVAVKNGNKEVRRCVPYVISERDKKLLFYYFFIIFMIFVLFRVMNWLVILRKNLVKTYDKSEREQIDIEKHVDEKKNEIRKLCTQLHIGNEKKNIVVKEYEDLLKCKIHEDFIWCLKYFIKPDKRLLTFPFSGLTEEGFDFIGKTLEQRQQGLPDEYYVIAVKNNYCLCGKVRDGQIYSFSRGLGITHTKYLDIYDFILDELSMCSKSSNVR